MSLGDTAPPTLVRWVVDPTLRATHNRPGGGYNASPPAVKPVSRSARLPRIANSTPRTSASSGGNISAIASLNRPLAKSRPEATQARVCSTTESVTCPRCSKLRSDSSRGPSTRRETAPACRYPRSSLASLQSSKWAGLGQLCTLDTLLAVPVLLSSVLSLPQTTTLIHPPSPSACLRQSPVQIDRPASFL